MDILNQHIRREKQIPTALDLKDRGIIANAFDNTRQKVLELF